jgi:hypothetical protein
VIAVTATWYITTKLPVIVELGNQKEIINYFAGKLALLQNALNELQPLIYPPN